MVEEEPWLLQHKWIKPHTHHYQQIQQIQRWHLCYVLNGGQLKNNIGADSSCRIQSWWWSERNQWNQQCPHKQADFVKVTPFATFSKYGDFTAPLLLRTDLKTEHCGLKTQTESRSGERRVTKKALTCNKEMKKITKSQHRADKGSPSLSKTAYFYLW